jgi:hypothetical protein
MKNLLVATVVSAAAIGSSACTRGSVMPPVEWSPPVERLESPAGPASAQPQLSTSEHGVVLSWLENAGSMTTLRFSQRTASGWSEPQAVVSGRDFFVNWADVPSVVRLADRSLVAHWLQKIGPGTYAYDVRLSRSSDSGRTWSPAFSPHHDGTQNEHGFASLYDVRGAGLGLVWLDGRAMKAGATSDEDGTGDMSLRAAVFDREWKQLSEDAIDLRVCECCPTAAAVTSDGVIVAYRDRSADETRNIAVVRLTGGKWTEPAPVHDDKWQINGCPVNGPERSGTGAGRVLAGRRRTVRRAHSRRRRGIAGARRRGAAAGRLGSRLVDRARRQSGDVQVPAGRSDGTAVRGDHCRRHRRQPQQRLSADGPARQRAAVRVDGNRWQPSRPDGNSPYPVRKW